MNCQFKDSKWSLAQNLDFSMGLNFLGPKMALAIAHAKKGAKKVSGPAKSLDFVPGPFRMLDRDHLKSLNRSHLVILQG